MSPLIAISKFGRGTLTPLAPQISGSTPQSLRAALDDLGVKLAASPDPEGRLVIIYTRGLRAARGLPECTVCLRAEAFTPSHAALALACLAISGASFAEGDVIEVTFADGRSAWLYADAETRPGELFLLQYPRNASPTLH